LLPSPVSRHEIAETVVSRLVVFLKGGIVELPIKIRIGNQTANKRERVPKPNIIFSIHPIGDIVLGSLAIILHAEGLPSDVTERESMVPYNSL
jgi:hypothetical protein